MPRRGCNNTQTLRTCLCTPQSAAVVLLFDQVSAAVQSLFRRRPRLQFDLKSITGHDSNRNIRKRLGAKERVHVGFPASVVVYS